MSASDISRLSTVYGKPTLEIQVKNAAIREIKSLIEKGVLSKNDERRIREEYTRIFYYYKGYYERSKHLGASSIIYVPMQNPKRYPGPHTAAKFSKSNLFIHVHRSSDCITVGRYNYPLDEEETLETREAVLLEWVGPLDRRDDQLKRKVTSYINLLWLRERHRKIKYINSSSDEQRKRILEILKILLSGNGVIDAKSITLLLLKQDQVEINQWDKDMDILKKNLLIGQRKEGSKYAKTKKLWNHATCLCLLDEFQPPRVCDRNNIVQHLEDLIESVDESFLSIVYRALFNRIQKPDSKSNNFIKHPNVGIDDYKFAILCANDCEIEFDQSREDFKLIVAAKNATSVTTAFNHVISLGHRHIETEKERRDEDYPSYQSNVSFEKGETHASKTAIISNLDMLILNEIWEYCLNMAHGTCDLDKYRYIIDLVPYKLIFASKLLDFGLLGMFNLYMDSIRRAINKAKEDNFIGADQFYDWNVIERCVEYISQVSKFCSDDITLAHESTSGSPGYIQFNANPLQPITNASQLVRHEPTDLTYIQPPQSHVDNTDSSQDLNSLPYDSSNNYQQQNNLKNWQQHQQPQRQQHQFHHQQQLPSQPPHRHQQHHQSLVLKQQVQPQPNASLASVPLPNSTVASVALKNSAANIPPPTSYQSPEETNNFNPDVPAYDSHQNVYNDYSHENSRRTSIEPVFSPPSQVQNSSIEQVNQNAMTSSSPINQQNRNSLQSNTMNDCFNAYSPISEYDDLARQNPVTHNESNVGKPIPPSYTNSIPAPRTANRGNDTTDAMDRSNPINRNSNNNAANRNLESKSKSQQPGTSSTSGSNDPQQPGIMASIARFLPKSNSKQMILPEDTDPQVVFDEEKNRWVDKSKPDGDGNDDFVEPPPMVANHFKSPNAYSAPKSTRARYPKSQF